MSRRVADSLVVLSCLGCLGTLGAGAYPGLVGGLLCLAGLVAVFALPVAAVVLAAGAFVLHRRGRLGDVRVPWGHAGVTGAAVLCTCVLLGLRVPQVVGFAGSRSAFDRTVGELGSAGNEDPRAGRRFGIYEVAEYAADPRGGVYFVTLQAGDGLGPDTMSYGFAYRPNDAGSPFGAASYATFPLGGGWYSFRASDDWF